MINAKASKWDSGVVVTFDAGAGGARRVMYAAHVFDNPDATFDGDGLVLYTPQYWYNMQPVATAPWLRSSWLLESKVEQDGDGFRFDGPTGSGTIRAIDYDTLEATRVAVSMIRFADDVKAAGTSIPEEWARLDRDEIIRQAGRA